jgi:hypothetical protein
VHGPGVDRQDAVAVDVDREPVHAAGAGPNSSPAALVPSRS